MIETFEGTEEGFVVYVPVDQSGGHVLEGYVEDLPRGAASLMKIVSGSLVAPASTALA